MPIPGNKFNESGVFVDQKEKPAAETAGFPNDGQGPDYFWLSAACAAARRAMGTRNGEQLT